MDSKVEENYKRLREELNERLNNDKRLTAIMDKISKGTATFKDSAEYSQIVADHMGDVISKNIGNIKIPMGKEMVCKELLKENIERVDTVFGKVQVSVDEKMGIHLNPVTPPYPTERVNAIAHSLEDPNADDEKVARRGKSSGNVVAARHDENVKANAAWREKAGFDCYLVRDAGGGCCPWCAALEGRYEYASAPDDIFRRHDNCTCTVTYECGKMRQDVWSKRTWEASPEELQARKDAAEAAKPTIIPKEQAQAIDEQSKATKFSQEQAKAIDEQSKNKITRFSQEQAKAIDDAAIERYKPHDPENVNKNKVEKSEESGIINIEIDELTPCLRDNKTGELVETEVRQIIDYNELKECTPQNGWDFTWDKPPKDSEVYAVSVKDSTEIEGLIALRSEPKNDAVYMYWGNAAPHNRITDNNTEKKYNGVGGHLFAVAIHKSLQNGFGGVIYADAANKELLSHFINEHGAFPIGTHEHPYRFLLDGESAKNLFKTYNFDWR